MKQGTGEETICCTTMMEAGSGRHCDHAAILRARRQFPVERGGAEGGGAVHQVSRSGRADYWLCGEGRGALRTRSAAAVRLFAAGPCCGVAHTVESHCG